MNMWGLFICTQRIKISFKCCCVLISNRKNKCPTDWPEFVLCHCVAGPPCCVIQLSEGLFLKTDAERECACGGTGSSPETHICTNLIFVHSCDLGRGWHQQCKAAGKRSHADITRLQEWYCIYTTVTWKVHSAQHNKYTISYKKNIICVHFETNQVHWYFKKYQHKQTQLTHWL